MHFCDSGPGHPAEARCGRVCHSGDMKSHHVLPSSPELRHLVQAYLLIDDDDPQESQRVSLPEHTAHLMFFVGRGWEIGPDGVVMPIVQASLSGLSLIPTRMVSSGPIRAVGVELYPWAARQLFGWSYPDPPLNLLDGAAGIHAQRAAQQIMAALTNRDTEAAMGGLNAWLLRLAAERGRTPGVGVQAAVQLYHSHGQRRMTDLADALNLSTRTLERQFQQEVGIGAKTLARLIRFELSSLRLRRTPDTPLAALAYDMGFSDQAHLTREFRALAGLTPGAFARLSELRNEHETVGDVFDVRMLPPLL